MAEAYYGVPSDIKKTAMSYLDKGLREIVVEFEKKYSSTKMYQSVIEFMRKDEEHFLAGILYDLLQHSFMTDYSHGHNLKNALKKQGKKEIEELDFSKLSLREIFGARKANLRFHNILSMRFQILQSYRKDFEHN